jgi:hypothetical protein
VLASFGSITEAKAFTVHHKITKKTKTNQNAGKHFWKFRKLCRDLIKLTGGLLVRRCWRFVWDVKDFPRVCALVHCLCLLSLSITCFSELWMRKMWSQIRERAKQAVHYFSLHKYMPLRISNILIRASIFFNMLYKSSHSHTIILYSPD